MLAVTHIQKRKKKPNEKYAGIELSKARKAVCVSCGITKVRFARKGEIRESGFRAVKK